VSPRGKHAAGPEPVRRPIASRMHPGDAARFAAEGEHCEHRRCRNPAVVVTRRWFRSAAARRVLLAEHMVCVDHGREFADRHHVEIQPPPDEPSRGRGTPGKTGPR
jgi:hypothetical protein